MGAGEGEGRQAKLSTHSWKHTGTTKQNWPLVQITRSLAKGDHSPSFPLGPGHPPSGSLTQPLPSNTLSLSLLVLSLVSGNSQANLQASSTLEERKEEVAEKCRCRLGELSLCPAEASTKAVFQQAVLVGKSCLSIWPSPARKEPLCLL